MINKKIFPIFCMVFLVASICCVSAVNDKPIDKENQLDFKSVKYTITEEGIKDSKTKSVIKDKEKSEIWIEKKEGNTYHVDSIVEEDTTVDIALFYDVQPDTIEYISHNGKYHTIYTYNDWIWEDKDCGEEYCGGYVTISDVILEYGTGSNTFTSAISGATWRTDGVEVSLTEDTDYNITSDGLFTLIDENYQYSQILSDWEYSANSNFQNDLNYILSNSSTGITGFFSSVSPVYGILAILVIIIILLVMVNVVQSPINKNSTPQL